VRRHIAFVFSTIRHAKMTSLFPINPSSRTISCISIPSIHIALRSFVNSAGFNDVVHMLGPMLGPTSYRTCIVVMLLCTLLRNGALDRVIVVLESSLRVALAWDRLGGRTRNIGGERLPCTLKRHCLAAGPIRHRPKVTP
jgi:hypothetical protein